MASSRCRRFPRCHRHRASESLLRPKADLQRTFCNEEMCYSTLRQESLAVLRRISNRLGQLPRTSTPVAFGSTEFHTAPAHASTNDAIDARYLTPLLATRCVPQARRNADDVQAVSESASSACAKIGFAETCRSPYPRWRSSGGLRRSWMPPTVSAPNAAKPSPNSTPSPKPSSSTCSARQPTSPTRTRLGEDVLDYQRVRTTKIGSGADFFDEPGSPG